MNEQNISRTNFEKVVEFNETFKPNVDYLRLIFEELYETVDAVVRYEAQALNDFDPYFEENEITKKRNLAKEIADLLYVVYGLAYQYDIPIDRVFEEVHKSNMSKLGSDCKPIKDQNGKIMKGPNYKEPNLDFIKYEY